MIKIRTIIKIRGEINKMFKTRKNKIQSELFFGKE